LGGAVDMWDMLLDDDDDDDDDDDELLVQNGNFVTFSGDLY
jgi:hypothetical protein